MAGWLRFPWGGQVDFCALSLYLVYIKARVSRGEINFCNLNSKFHEKVLIKNANMNGKNYVILTFDLLDRGSVKYQAILNWLILESRPIFEEMR